MRKPVRKGKKILRRYLDDDGVARWRFVLYGSNGRPMLTSGGFNRLTDCMSCLEKLTMEAATWPTEVQ